MLELLDSTHLRQIHTSSLMFDTHAQSLASMQPLTNDQVSKPREPAPSNAPGGLPTYRPQFSEATASWLRTLNTKDSSREATDSSSVQKETVSSLQTPRDELAKPPSLAPASIALPETSKSHISSRRDLHSIHQASLKRKRPHSGSIDFSQNTIALPSPRAPGPDPDGRHTSDSTTPVPPVAREKPRLTAASPSSEHRNARNATVHRCSVCHDGMDSRDRILSCRRCSVSSHMFCVATGRGAPKSEDFLCEPCASEERKKQKLNHALPERDDSRGTGTLRRDNLARLPKDVHLPPRIHGIGFTAGEASDLARTEYFYSKTKSELLNLVSFCDELAPQLLVDVLVSISKKHPEAPIFDSPNWADRILGEAQPQPSGSHANYRPRHGHTLQPKSRPRHKSLKKYFHPKSTDDSAPGAEETDQVEDSSMDVLEDTLPPTWPKAGEGLYAQLVSEVEDRKYLIDEDDEEAFSHFLVDKSGKQIVEPSAM